MMRLFTGLEISADAALDLKMMQSGIAGARWIDATSFHITLRFMGDIDVGVGREVAYALQRLEFKPFTLTLKNIDVFGGKNPHALIIHVGENEELRRLQQAQERLCQSFGLEPEQRKFIPHVTLARLRDVDVVDLRNFVVSHSLYRSPAFEVKGFNLYSSRPSRGGGPYAIEQSYGLQNA
jgi:RNA 2',3'-cyclic 3'-phosphodiesterase